MDWIVFVHVFSAVIWVGGMIIVRFVVHPSLQHMTDTISRLEMSLKLMKRLFRFMMPFILLMVVTGVALFFAFASSQDVQGARLFLIKEVILGIMVLNYLWMIRLRYHAERIFKNTHFPKARETLMMIPHYLLPLNIILGVVALYFGVALRGL